MGNKSESHRWQRWQRSGLLDTFETIEKGILMITRKNRSVKAPRPQSVGPDSTATTSRPPTVDEFLKVNPLPAQLNHLEPSLRKLPSVSMLLEIMMGCLAYDMSGADLDRIIADVGEMFSQERQRCAACFCWAPQFHAIVVGKAERFAVVPMCDNCVNRFEAGRQSKQMERNLNSYAGEVATK